MLMLLNTNHIGFLFLFLTNHIVLNTTGRDPKNADTTCEAVADDAEKGVHSTENSTIFTSLPVAINWLRDSVRKNQSVRHQVI